MRTVYIINTKRNHLLRPFVMEHIKIGIKENGMIYEPLILNEKDSFQIQFQKLANITQKDAIVTIDFGLKKFMTLSNGDSIAYWRIRLLYYFMFSAWRLELIMIRKAVID